MLELQLIKRFARERGQQNLNKEKKIISENVLLSK
jgi:hypothetical protein